MSAPTLRVGVCGIGLIGGSLLLALRDAGFAVRGCDLRPAPRTWGAEHAIPTDETPEATARAVDVLVVCVPPHAVASVAAAALAANPQLIVVDTASVKAPVVDELRRRAPDAADRFLPAHPLAGAERGGHAAAHADLLRDAPWAVCPPADDPEGDSASLAPLLTVAPLFDALGARVVVCPADEHDRAVAATSHAPHLMAGAVAAEAVAGESGPLAAVLSGGALRDITRVAGAPVGLWLEVLHANAAATADVLEAVAARLRDAAAAVRSGDHGRLEAAWGSGSAAHARITEARWAPREWAPFVTPARWSALLALGRDGVAVRALRTTPDGRVTGERSVAPNGRIDPPGSV